MEQPPALVGCGVGVEPRGKGQSRDLGMGPRDGNRQRNAAVAAVHCHGTQVISLEFGKEIGIPVRPAVDHGAFFAVDDCDDVLAATCGQLAGTLKYALSALSVTYV